MYFIHSGMSSTKGADDYFPMVMSPYAESEDAKCVHNFSHKTRKKEDTW